MVSSMHSWIGWMFTRLQLCQASWFRCDIPGNMLRGGANSHRDKPCKENGHFTIVHLTHGYTPLDRLNFDANSDLSYLYTL